MTAEEAEHPMSGLPVTRHVEDEFHEGDVDAVIVLSRLALFDKAVLGQGVEILRARLPADTQIVLQTFDPDVGMAKQVDLKLLVANLQEVIPQTMLHIHHLLPDAGEDL